MELLQEMLAHLLAQGEIQVSFPDLENLTEALEAESYQALRKIKAVIEDDSLDDRECFQKIEEVIRIFEALGSSGGTRHDYG